MSTKKFPFALLLALLATLNHGSAQLTTLLSFSSTNASGNLPQAGLTLSADGGTLYGTTESGGSYEYGTVFSLPVTGGAPTTLIAFDNTDGGGPASDLILSDGILYGTTLGGGSGGGGTVFSEPITGGTPTTLTNFTLAGSAGYRPDGGLLMNGSTLYGTASAGGANHAGAVYTVSVTGGATNALATFSSVSGGADEPNAGLILSGNTLYGTTTDGGQNNGGAVFSVPSTGGTITTLASFNGGNGLEPLAGLTLSGNVLYGTTAGGGGANNYGTVFALNLNTDLITNLVDFSGLDGSGPAAGLTLCGHTLYGTTEYGGTNNDGTVFAFDLNTNQLTTLVNFNGSNGANPESDLTLSANGETLYGTTAYGGANGVGTVFALDIAAVPEPSSCALLLGGLGLLLWGLGVRRA